MITFKHIDSETLPKGWSVKLLQDLVTYHLGRTPPRNSKQYWDDGAYPWVSIADIPPYGTIFDTSEKVSEEAHTKLFQRRLTPAGTILMSFKLTIGRVAKLGIPAYHNEAIISIFPKEPDYLFGDYLFYYLSQIDYRQYQDTAVKGMTLNKSKIDQLEIAFPPVNEQRRIAYVLSTVQTAIEQQERLIVLTRELKSALMHKLFTKGLRGEKQKETNIGLVPESWETRTIGNIAKLQSGGTPSRENPKFWTGGTIPWVKTTEINYRVIETTQEFITEEGLNNSAAKVLPKGTMLAAMYGQGVTRGRVGILGLDAAANQACAAITPLDKKQILTWFLYYYMQFHYQDLRDLGHGANQLNLNLDLIKSFPLSYPEIEEQQCIIDSLSAFDKKLLFIEQKRDLLEELFRTLLHQLMTGQTRVNSSIFDFLGKLEGNGYA